MAEVMVPIFRVAGGEAAAAWYGCLGFTVDGVHRCALDVPARINHRDVET